MSRNTQQYNIVELHSGVKGICRYDRIGALAAAHELNKKHQNERYAICAV